MAKLLLDTAAVEEDFFEDCKLAAIGSALPGYSLCWIFNRLFGLDFRRTPENDICILAGETQAATREPCSTVLCSGRQKKKKR